MLHEAALPRMTVDLRGFAAGPKDMLDAYVGAVTVGEFIAGRGSEVGGGDGLGTIVLPKTLPSANPALLQWPDSSV
jgi:hypothetical protein